MVRIPPKQDHDIVLQDSPNALDASQTKGQQFLYVIQLQFLQAVPSIFAQFSDRDTMVVAIENLAQCHALKVLELFSNLRQLGTCQLVPSERIAHLHGADSPSRTEPSWVLIIYPTRNLRWLRANLRLGFLVRQNVAPLERIFLFWPNWLRACDPVHPWRSPIK